MARPPDFALFRIAMALLFFALFGFIFFFGIMDWSR